MATSECLELPALQEADGDCRTVFPLSGRASNPQSHPATPIPFALPLADRAENAIAAFHLSMICERLVESF